MQYKVNHNGVNAVLPSFSLGVKKRIDETTEKIADSETGIDMKVEGLYDFLKEAIGDETLEKMLGTNDIEAIDLNDLNILYMKITKEYEKPVNEFKKPVLDNETRKMFQDISNVAKSIDNINAVAAKK